MRQTGNAKGGSITVLSTSCWTGLESAVWQLTILVFICKTDQSEPVKQEVNRTVILPCLVFPETNIHWMKNRQMNVCQSRPINENSSKSFFMYTFIEVHILLNIGVKWTIINCIFVKVRTTYPKMIILQSYYSCNYS
jgi:hypothetical protein